VSSVAAGIGGAALAAVLALGFWGTLFGGFMALGEVQRAPAALAAVALLVLLRGASGLPAAAAWAVLGSAVAVLLRHGAGFPAEGGWIPGEATTGAERVLEAGWLALVAVLSWRGMPPSLAGPLLAGVVATTRLGGHGQALVPVLWEDTLREAVLVSVNLVAGFAAGVIVVMLAGWGLAVLVRLPERRVAPGRVLAALAAAAAVGHMLHG
jgi:hypothetical protein